MTPHEPTLAERAALRLVPARDRETLLGDLAEEGPLPPLRRAACVGGVALAYQGEPYRDSEGRLGAALLLMSGLALMLYVPEAVEGMDPRIFTDPVTRGFARFWMRAAEIAASAAGLLVGRLPVLPPRANVARWHVALLLALSAATIAPDRHRGVACAALLLAAVVVGDRARGTLAPGGRGTTA